MRHLAYMSHYIFRACTSRFHGSRHALKLRMWGMNVGSDFRAEGRHTWFFDRHSKLSIGNKVCIRDGVRIHINDHGRITIEDNVEIKSNVTLEVRGHLHIQNGALLVDGTCIYCQGDITIGQHTMIAAHTTISDCEHGTALNGEPMQKQKLVRIKPIVIEDDCWIGSHSTILGGVTIGQGSIVGAAAVVKSDIPPYSVAVGAPAVVKSSRRDNTIDFDNALESVKSLDFTSYTTQRPELAQD